MSRFQTDDQKVIEWLASRDTGLSSESLAYEFLGIKKTDIREPADPADLGRCLRLIRKVPAVRACVDSLAKKYKRWECSAKHWDEWAKSMAEEVGIDWEKGSVAHQTYDLMDKHQQEWSVASA